MTDKVKTIAVGVLVEMVVQNACGFAKKATARDRWGLSSTFIAVVVVVAAAAARRSER